MRRGDREGVLGIDGSAVLDAAFLRPHGGDVGAEGLQDLAALAGLGGDDCDYVDHGWISVERNFSRSDAPPMSTPFTNTIGKLGQPVHILSGSLWR